MKLEIHHYIGLFVFSVLMFMAYHHLMLFGLCPGEKNLTKKAATRKARYIATVADIAEKNSAASNGATLTGPTPLPLADTLFSSKADKAA
jgi:hypothetical protein